MASERTMSTTWRGTLTEGSGTIAEARSGAFGALDVSWAARLRLRTARRAPRS